MSYVMKICHFLLKAWFIYLSYLELRSIWNWFACIKQAGNPHLFFPYAQLIDLAPFITKTVLSPRHCSVSPVSETSWPCMCVRLFLHFLVCYTGLFHKEVLLSSSVSCPAWLSSRQWGWGRGQWRCHLGPVGDLWWSPLEVAAWFQVVLLLTRARVWS